MSYESEFKLEVGGVKCVDSHIAIFSSTAVAEGTEEYYDIVLNYSIRYSKF